MTRLIFCICNRKTFSLTLQLDMRAARIKELRKETFTSWSIIIAVAVMVGVCCMLCPWLDDDIIYQYNFRWSENNEIVPIRTIGDIFESQYYHYFSGNGRYVAHWIVQLFDGILGQTAFAIADGIVYILFIRMIMLTCGIKMTNWQGVLTTACLVITCQCLRMTPAFQMYVWMYLLVLCYLWILMHYHTRKWWMLMLLCVFSLLCGNGHESLNPGIVVGVGLYILTNRGKITLQQWLMYGFFCLGLLILLSSPATQSRIGQNIMALEYKLLSLYGLRNAIPAFYILIVVTLYKTIIKKESLLDKLRRDIIWWGVWGTMTTLILFFGLSFGRAALGEELAAVILTLKQLKHRSFTPFWLTLLTALTILFLYVQFNKISEVRGYMEEVRRQALANADGNIYVDFRYTPIYTGLEQYAPSLTNTNFHGEKAEARLFRLFDDSFRRKWGVDHHIRIYPTALRPYIEGKADTTDGNLLTEISPGFYLIVRNKKHPAKFYVSYKRDIIFLEKDFPWREIPEINPGLMENDQWTAEIVRLSYYHIRYPATFSMTKPDSAASGAN